MISTPALEGRAARQRMPRGYRQVSSPELSSQTALFSGVRGETVWKMRPDMMMAYALRYGEQEIPHGSVRRRMALHRPSSS
jgi:hypothetical protein